MDQKYRIAVKSNPNGTWRVEFHADSQVFYIGTEWDLRRDASHFARLFQDALCRAFTAVLEEPRPLLDRLDEAAAQGLDGSPGDPLAEEAAKEIRRLRATETL